MNYIGTDALEKLEVWLKQKKNQGACFFILVDNNTDKHCLPLLLKNCKTLKKASVVSVKSGEENKTIQVCTEIWRGLIAAGAKRSDLLINLGGGVITDIGGFAASVFKRGIEFINIPTTLLSQVDASFGGKTGIDLDSLKNEIGLFNNPALTVIYPDFLRTLPDREFSSGYAEIIKHALIADSRYWKQILKTGPKAELKNNLLLADIVRSVQLKTKIVNKDPREKGYRKILNFGHSVGHALESYFLNKGAKKVLHGEAVAAGMICESWLSHKRAGLSLASLSEINRFIRLHYPELKFSKKEYGQLIGLMQHDKKNKGKELNFTLLSKIGGARFDQTCTAELIMRSFDYYHEQYK